MAHIERPAVRETVLGGVGGARLARMKSRVAGANSPPRRARRRSSRRRLRDRLPPVLSGRLSLSDGNHRAASIARSGALASQAELDRATWWFRAASVGSARDRCADRPQPLGRVADGDRSRVTSRSTICDRMAMASRDSSTSTPEVGREDPRIWLQRAFGPKGAADDLGVALGRQSGSFAAFVTVPCRPSQAGTGSRWR